MKRKDDPSNVLRLFDTLACNAFDTGRVRGFGSGGTKGGGVAGLITLSSLKTLVSRRMGGAEKLVKKKCIN